VGSSYHRAVDDAGDRQAAACRPAETRQVILTFANPSGCDGPVRSGQSRTRTGERRRWTEVRCGWSTHPQRPATPARCRRRPRQGAGSTSRRRPVPPPRSARSPTTRGPRPGSCSPWSIPSWSPASTRSPVPGSPSRPATASTSAARRPPRRAARGRPATDRPIRTRRRRRAGGPRRQRAGTGRDEFLNGWAFDVDEAALRWTEQQVHRIADLFGGRHVSAGELRDGDGPLRVPDAVAQLAQLSARAAEHGLLVDVWHFFNCGATFDDLAALADLPMGGGCGGTAQRRPTGQRGLPAQRAPPGICRGRATSTSAGWCGPSSDPGSPGPTASR
jgi:hypothetical protein